MQPPRDPTDDAVADPLLAGLAGALRQAGSPHARAALQRLPAKGLAHHHVRLCGTGLLARIPIQSQMGLRASDNLAYQRACFERAQPCGHTPRLVGTLAPAPGLPRGALLVEEVVGRPLRLPQHLPALAQALARLHALPVPPVRAPLLAAADPLRALWDEIRAQAQHLPQAGLDPGTRCVLEGQLARLRDTVALDARPPVHLVAFDAHPGNFIVRPDGAAVLVDLEKCRYAYPGLDLAHATLYTSTTWDVDACSVLDDDQVAGFVHDWERRMPDVAARAARPWHVPLRRAMGLWSLTWCAKWRVLSARPPDARHRGEDWSAQAGDPALVRHVRDRVDHYLTRDVAGRFEAGLDTLEARLR